MRCALLTWLASCCVFVAAQADRNLIQQLQTLDPQVIHEFENDPCLTRTCSTPPAHDEVATTTDHTVVGSPPTHLLAWDARESKANRQEAQLIQLNSTHSLGGTRMNRNNPTTSKKPRF